MVERIIFAPSRVPRNGIFEGIFGCIGPDLFSERVAQGFFDLAEMAIHPILILGSEGCERKAGAEQGQGLERKLRAPQELVSEANIVEGRLKDRVSDAEKLVARRRRPPIFAHDPVTFPGPRLDLLEIGRCPCLLPGRRWRRDGGPRRLGSSRKAELPQSILGAAMAGG
jgi:hypothetical protein